MHQKNYQKLFLEIVSHGSTKNCKTSKDQFEVGKGYGTIIKKTINGVLIRNITGNILNYSGHPDCCICRLKLLNLKEIQNIYIN